MSKFFKIITFLIALPLFLLIGIYLLLPWLIPLNQFSDKIESAIDEQINGKSDVQDLKLSTFPWLGIRIKHLVINNSPEFKESDLLRVGKAGIKIKALPLLKGKIIGQILIDKPIIRFEKLANDRASHEVILKENPKKAPPKEKTEKSSDEGFVDRLIDQALDNLKIQSLSLTNGEFRSISYAANGDSTVDLDLKHLSVDLENLSPQGEMPAEIAVSFFDLSKPDIQFKGIIETNLDFQGSHQLIKIQSASLVIGLIPIKLAGTLSKKKSESLFVNLEIKSDGFSFGSAVRSIPPLKEKVPEHLNGDLKFHMLAKGPTDPFEKMRIDFQFESNILSSGIDQKLKLTDANIRGWLQNNVIKFEEIKAGAYDGRVSSTGTVHLLKTGPQLDFQTDLSDVDLTLLANAFEEKKNLVEGKLNASYHLNGSPGNTQSSEKEKTEETYFPEWILSKGKMNIGEGQFNHLNILGDLTKALVKFAPLTDSFKASLQRSKWRSFHSNFSTKDGAFFLDPVFIDYGIATLQAKGTTTRDKKQDFRGEIKLPKNTVTKMGSAFFLLTDKQGKITVPFRVTGDVGDSKTYIDVVKMGKNATRGQMKRLGNEAKDLLQGFNPLNQPSNPKK